MPYFDAKADSPRATAVASNDVLAFGDVSADRWETILFSDLFTQILAQVPSTTPGGSDAEIQYNNGGAFGGVTGLTWDDQNSRLLVGSARLGVGTSLPLAQLHVRSETPLLTSLIADAPVGNGSPAAEFRDGSQNVVAKVMPTDLRVLQPGGTVNTDEVRISHDGTDTNVRSMFGSVNIDVAAGSKLCVRRSDATARTASIDPDTSGGGTTFNSWADLYLQANTGASAMYLRATEFVLNNANHDRDISLKREAPGQLFLTNGIGGGGGALVLQEITEPGNAASNKGVLFLKDNGAGKSQLCVRFASGATQVIATEP